LTYSKKKTKRKTVFKKKVGRGLSGMSEPDLWISVLGEILGVE
jgi:hypothetical protein